MDESQHGRTADYPSAASSRISPARPRRRLRQTEARRHLGAVLGQQVGNFGGHFLRDDVLGNSAALEKPTFQHGGTNRVDDRNHCLFGTRFLALLLGYGVELLKNLSELTGWRVALNRYSSPKTHHGIGAEN